MIRPGPLKLFMRHYYHHNPLSPQYNNMTTGMSRVRTIAHQDPLPMPISTHLTWKPFDLAFKRRWTTGNIWPQPCISERLKGSNRCASIHSIHILGQGCHPNSMVHLLCSVWTGPRTRDLQVSSLAYPHFASILLFTAGMIACWCL